MCYKPLQAWDSDVRTSKGSYKKTLNPSRARRRPKMVWEDGYPVAYVCEHYLPCNRCLECRFRYSRDWSVRICHEAHLWEPTLNNPGVYGNSFITLTYNDKFLPLHGSLNFDHWTKFMKRLRKRFSTPDHFTKSGKFRPGGFYLENGIFVPPRPIRFYMGPEYGELNLRPHYHAILFNITFPDQYFFKKVGSHDLFRSDELERLWTDPDTGESYGYASIGNVTPDSAAYVAGYMHKKVKGDIYLDPEQRYIRVNPISGECFPVEPEKARMSNRDGIGKNWFDQFAHTDVYNKDFVTMNGKEYRPPKYYDALLERITPQVYEEIKAARQLNFASIEQEYTPERLKDREINAIAKFKSKNRKLSHHKELYDAA